MLSRQGAPGLAANDDQKPKGQAQPFGLFDFELAHTAAAQQERQEQATPAEAPPRSAADAPSPEDTRAGAELGPSVVATARFRAALDTESSLLADLRRSLASVREAFRVVEELGSTADMPTMCRRIAHAAVELVTADAGTVLLLDDQGQVEARYDHDTRAGFELSRTVVNHVFTHKEGVLALDVPTDQRWSEVRSLQVGEVRSLLCVPMLHADEVQGVIYVSSGTRARAFNQADLELLAGIGAGAGVAIANSRMSRLLAEEQRKRDALGRFFSPSLTRMLMSGDIGLEPGGSEHDVTILFTDIRGFTNFTESHAPKEVVALLNDYFEHMVELVFEHGGLLDKFIGDSVMAVWGAPLRSQSTAGPALAAARAMDQATRRLDATRRALGKAGIEAGIGLASGPCIAGNVGSTRRMEYTVTGRAVNRASRLCAAARGGQVLVDAATVDLSDDRDRFDSLGQLNLKGLEACEVFALKR